MGKKQNNSSSQKWTPEDSPTAWFAVLERARQTSDFELAARAQRKLEYLGVLVRFSRQKKGVPDAR